MLTDKCRNQEALIAEFDSREQEYQELDAEIDFLKQQVESQRYASPSFCKSFLFKFKLLEWITVKFL
jgi:hypothetical protein